MAPFSELTFHATAQGADQPAVLLVDSDEDFRGGLAENLRDDGYAVWECTTPAGLGFSLGELRIDAAVIGTDGRHQEALNLADRLHRLYPEATIVLVSTYWSGTTTAQAAKRPFLTLRSKPIDYEEITALLRRIRQPPRV